MATFGFQKKFFALFVLIGCLFVSVNSVSGGSSDKYEPDNTIETAREILLNPMLPEKLLPLGYEWEQIHNFYAPNDEDWVKFYTTKGNYYRISVKSPGKNCDPVIEIYDGNKNRVMLTDDYGSGHEEYAEFKSESDSMYYAGIRQCDLKDSACHASYGDNTEYHLTLIMPYINFAGSIEGYVSPIVAATVTIGPVTIPTRASDGYYLAFVPAGDLTLTVTADGYKPYSEAINIQECVDCDPYRKDIPLEKSGVSCVFADNDLALNICAVYQGVRYGFTMKFDDDAQLSWKMDVSTFGELQNDPGNCISVGSDLKLDMCVEYQGKNYGFTMNFYPNPNDPNGLYWKMDLSTFREVQ